MVATARIEHRNNGWSLVPVTEDGKPIVASLYGWDNYEDLEKDDDFQKGFCSEESLDVFLARVLRIAKENKHLSVSVCGSKTNPVLRFWDRTPLARQPAEKVRVDLKWACWSRDEGHWEQYAPGIWERMQSAFNGTQGPVEISTGPRKEIRYGSVEISKGQASGHFCTEWDDVESLADTLGLTDDNGDWKLPEEEQEELLSKYGREKLNADQDMCFRESIPFSMHTYEPGMDRDFTVKARSFAKLMERIDAEEDQLLQDDKREWELIEEIYRTK